VDYETGRSTTADPSRVTDRDSFGTFLEVVLGDLQVGGGESEWENSNLADFLGALAVFADARVVGRDDPGGSQLAAIRGDDCGRDRL
jgi:hypothetical protein